MTWEIKDEWIDPARGVHSVVYHNREFLQPNEAGKMVPVEHHLVHHFKLKACPHCGSANVDAQGIPLDFAAKKTETHEALTAHHKAIMDYRAKHPQVRLGSEPKG